MKKTAAMIFALFMLMCIGFASATPGGADDPLVSRQYADGVFVTDSVGKIEIAADDRFADVYISGLAKVTGYNYSEEYIKVSVGKEKALFVSTGGSAVLLSGNAGINADGGTVLDITNGVEVPDGTDMTRGHRYFSAEKTVARYEPESGADIFVKGWYVVKNAETPDDPVLREFTPDTFKDVPADSWYYDAVSFGYSRYMYNGVGGDMFGADDSITRADFLTIMYRMNGSPEVTEKSPFSDVKKESEYYYKAVVWGYTNGIVSGCGDGSFAPLEPINREQMMKMMYGYAILTGDNGSVRSPERISSFTDSAEISAWAYDCVKWAVGNEIINGNDEGKIMPVSTATRSEAAQIIYNFYKYLGN